MLVLTRKQGESLLIGNDIEVIVKEINPSHVNLRINVSENITIDKLEMIKLGSDQAKLLV